MRRKEERKERVWRAEDLLRVFPPWVEGLAGPVLAACRLAGSILTLGREEEQQEVKVNRHKTVKGRQKHTNCGEWRERGWEVREPKMSWRGRKWLQKLIKEVKRSFQQESTEAWRRQNAGAGHQARQNATEWYITVTSSYVPWSGARTGP